MGVETVDKSGRNRLNRKRVSALGLKKRQTTSSATLCRHAWPGLPQKGGMHHEIGAKSGAGGTPRPELGAAGACSTGDRWSHSDPITIVSAFSNSSACLL